MNSLPWLPEWTRDPAWQFIGLIITLVFAAGSVLRRMLIKQPTTHATTEPSSTSTVVPAAPLVRPSIPEQAILPSSVTVGPVGDQQKTQQHVMIESEPTQDRRVGRLASSPLGRLTQQTVDYVNADTHTGVHYANAVVLRLVFIIACLVLIPLFIILVVVLLREIPVLSVIILPALFYGLVAWSSRRTSKERK